jgi:CheY-like chemotaxis protein
LPNVFEMFSQVAPALERSQDGLGIGLSLVRGLVELHGGTIEARSDGQGLGSEFIVRLPTSQLPAHSAPPPPKTEISIRPVTCRVLIVDDNRDAADSLATVLKLQGHEVSTAYDGLEAIETAELFRPEAVLLDIGLPKMDGYETARRFRKHSWGKKSLLIALTGWGQDEDRQQASQAGFDYHLRKPAEPQEIQELLTRAGRSG